MTDAAPVGANIGRTDYDSIDAINWSSLKEMRISPKQFRYARENGRTDTAALKLGRAFHLALFEPERFDDAVTVFPGPVRRGKQWEAFQEENGHREILTRTEYERACGMRDAVQADVVARDYLAGAYAEQTFVWDDEETGLRCKCRQDMVGKRVIEGKSTTNIVPRRFASDVVRYGYHGQLAFYHDGARANGVDLMFDPVLIVVQSEPPFDVAVYRVPPEVLQVGRDEYRRLLNLLLDCLEHDDWPGVAGEEELTLELPAWAMPEAEQKLTMGGVELEV